MAFMASTPVLIGLTAAGTAATVYSTVQQGRAVSRQAKAQARQETIDARSREIARKKRLIATLAQQNVTAAQGGVAAFEGSTGNIRRADIRTSGLEGATDRASTQNTISALNAKASNARRASLVGSAATLAEGGVRFGELKR